MIVFDISIEEMRAYSQLEFSDTDRGFSLWQLGEDKISVDDWDPPKMKVRRPKKPQADFWCEDAFFAVLNRRAINALADILDRCGTLLPLQCPSDWDCQLIQVDLVPDALDVDNSRVEWELSGGKRRIAQVHLFAWRDEMLAQHPLFTLPMRSRWMYATEEFVNRLSEHGLSAPEFREVETREKMVRKALRKRKRKLVVRDLPKHLPPAAPSSQQTTTSVVKASAGHVDMLKKLVRGQVEPEEWFAWWSEHEGDFKRTAQLKLKPRHADVSVWAAMTSSQSGASGILTDEGIACTSSDRYVKARDEEYASQEAASGGEEETDNDLTALPQQLPLPSPDSPDGESCAVIDFVRTKRDFIAAIKRFVDRYATGDAGHAIGTLTVRFDTLSGSIELNVEGQRTGELQRGQACSFQEESVASAAFSDEEYYGSGPVEIRPVRGEPFLLSDELDDSGFAKPFFAFLAETLNELIDGGALTRLPRMPGASVVLEDLEGYWHCEWNV